MTRGVELRGESVTKLNARPLTRLTTLYGFCAPGSWIIGIALPET